ncbi:hypothetical protein [Olivibacter jilunii]|uniref:hypothetical protein n=1 Tax=Olivibacter jilunii TaxID=985016 RepID=UPI0013EF1803|nr:hypothetical protein [Olivibacter jilunii]
MQGQVLVRHSHSVIVPRPIVYAPRPYWYYGPYYYGLNRPTVVYTSSFYQESPHYTYKDGVYYKDDKVKADTACSRTNNHDVNAETFVTELPSEAVRVEIEGKVYYRSNDLWYKEDYVDNKMVFKLVGKEVATPQ